MVSRLSNTRFRLMPAGIQNVIAILTPDDIDGCKRLNGSGVGFGVSPHYPFQPSPDGWFQGLLSAEQFMGNCDVSLMLGDNIPRVQRFSVRHQAEYLRGSGATVFGHQVQDFSAVAERQGSHDYLAR
jgi:glucose-1-phosphate thymidylyltransferase